MSEKHSTRFEQKKKELRDRIIGSLLDQGFNIQSEELIPPDQNDKDFLRKLHYAAVQHNRSRSEKSLKKYEDELINLIASGDEIIPNKIQPILVEVKPNSIESKLFQYVRLHWSIPVSAGYGRRLRYVVYDENNGKLIGIFGMGDPVFSLGARDDYIGWNFEVKRDRLQFVMDLFVLGAVPPYSFLLCGKLIALLATCNEIQNTFTLKYGGKQALIKKRPLDGRLALLTTSSALGKSSIYNRLKYGTDLAYLSVGFTKGSGEFHFSNGFYDDLRDFALKYSNATARHKSWGNGFRNRREIVRKVLPLLGLPNSLAYHGVKREVFLIPLASNSISFLRGGENNLHIYKRSLSDIFTWFKHRWLLSRMERDNRYQFFNRDSYRLWEKE